MGLTNIIPVLLFAGLFGCQIILQTNGQFANSKSWPRYSLENMPKTKFTCRDKILGGYYADAEAQCQMFHICVKVAGVGVQDFRFLCPNGTAFDQEAQICADWGDIDCEAATLYYSSDNFDLYRIGSGFESKRAPYAEEEEEATFHLQRAETGDSRRSKQYIVNQNTRPAEPTSFNKQPVEFQKQQTLAPTTRQQPPSTTPAAVNNFSPNKNDYYNNNNNNNNNNNKNDFYNSQKSKNDYNKDDEIFKGSHSSHFYNNKDNGKEDFNEDFNRKTSTTPKPQQQQQQQQPQQYQPIRSRQRGRTNYRTNNVNNLPAVTKSTHAPTTTNLTPVNSFNNKQTLVPGGSEKQQNQQQQQQQRQFNNDKFNNFNQKQAPQTTALFATSTPNSVQFQTSPSTQFFTPTTLAPVPFKKVSSNRDAFKIFVPQQTTNADYQKPQQSQQPFPSTTQQNLYQTTTLPSTTQRVTFPQNQPTTPNRNQFYNTNFENKATEKSNNFFNTGVTDFQKVAQPRNYNTDSNNRANQFDNFNRKNQNTQSTTAIAPSTYNPHYNLKLTPQNSQNNFNQGAKNFNTSPAQSQQTTPASTAAPFFQERQSSNFFQTPAPVQQQQQQQQPQSQQLIQQQQPQHHRRVQPQQQNNFVTAPTTLAPTTTSTAAYTQFPPQPLINRQSSRFDSQNYRQQQQSEVQNSSPRGFSTNNFFDAQTTRTPTVTTTTTTTTVAPPPSTQAFNDNRYQTIARNNNNNNFQNNNNNNFQNNNNNNFQNNNNNNFQNNNNNFQNNNFNNNNNNNNDNYTPASIKKFSTLVPKESYYPTTFKPATFNNKKASDPFLIANQQKFDKNYYNVQAPTTAQTTRAPQTPPPPPPARSVVATTTTTIAPLKPDEEDDGQYRPELYEKDFYRNKQKAKLNNARNHNRNQNFYQSSTQSSATTVNSGEDEFLKTAHSQNIAASGNELRARQNAAKINDLLSEAKGKVKKTYESSPRPFSNAPTIPPNATTTKKSPTKNEDKDASYDYAYYDTGASKDYSEYDVIEDFGKTNRKSKN